MTKLLILLTFFSSCFSSETKKEMRLQESDKVLVVYLSRTNNTKALAEIIHQEVGGDLVPLELENPYPENYRAIVKQVAKENETGFLPPLKTKVDMKKYETIFIGFPTWGMQLPPPLKSFLTENNLEEKTVIPFNTNAGYGVGSSFDTIEILCLNSKILEGFSIKGGKERDGIFLAIKGENEKEAKVAIKSWLSKIKLGVVD